MTLDKPAELGRPAGDAPPADFEDLINGHDAMSPAHLVADLEPLPSAAVSIDEAQTDQQLRVSVMGAIAARCRHRKPAYRSDRVGDLLNRWRPGRHADDRRVRLRRQPFAPTRAQEAVARTDTHRRRHRLQDRWRRARGPAQA